MRASLVVWLATVVLVGCASEEGDKAAKPATAKDGGKAEQAAGESTVGSALKAPGAGEPAVTPPATPPAATLTTKTFRAKDLPASVKVQGRVTTGLRFDDKNGDNWVVFTSKSSSGSRGQSRYFYARHVAIRDGSARELRFVRDKVEDCPLDLTMDLDKRSLAVTDLDGDGIGEVAFGYELACAGDVSPADYKWLLLENGDKYIIRGTTSLSLPGEPPFKGTRRIDKSLKNGPPVFLEHAKKRWRKLTRRSL